MSRRTGRNSGSGLLETDPDRAATVLVLAGVVLTVAAVVLGGFLPAVDALVTVLYPLALLFPVIGAVLVLSAGWLLLSTLERSGPSPLVEGLPPEDADTATDHRVGRDVDWDLDSAGSERYRCRANSADSAVRRRLVDGAIRVLTATDGLEREAAAAAVEDGTWTDDPIAAAFLSTDGRQPPAERWRSAVDPGRAYERRVRRTLEVIEALDAGERPTTDETGATNVRNAADESNAATVRPDETAEREVSR